MSKNSLKTPKKSLEKARNWAFVAYPESLPQNWQDILTATGLPCCISPLHDADINADETQKKAHYHIILCYSGPTSFNVVSKITSKLNATIPQVVSSIKGYYRYFTHDDNPEKAQYDKRDIKCLNGFCISDYVELTKSEALQLKTKIIQFICDNEILEYSDLLINLLKIGEFEMFDYASSQTILFNNFVSSRRNKLKLR